MPRQYSITAARANLASLIEAVLQGDAVELTRRGRPVAVLLSVSEYRRMTSGTPDLAGAIREFRARYDLSELDVDEVYRDVRYRAPGRNDPA